MKHLLIILLSIWSINLFAQDTNRLHIQGYADGYYSWYSDADNTELQQHDVIGAYHNNIGLNIVQMGIGYEADRIRTQLTLHYGDIPALTWSLPYRNVQEAYAGVRLAKGLWIDAGFFKTHVGTESFLPKDNLMSIITLGTYYGPFYQSGIRLSYTTTSDWHFELHAINGYNAHFDNNSGKTFGLFVSKQFNEAWSASYSNMIGEESTGVLRDDLMFYQSVAVNRTSESLEFQAGMDVAVLPQGTNVGGSGHDPLISGLATVKYHISPAFAVALRGEIFSDRSNLISQELGFAEWVDPLSGDLVGTTQNYVQDGIFAIGTTLGFEYKAGETGFLRVESRWLNSPDKASGYPNNYVYPIGRNFPAQALENRIQAMFTIGVYFDKAFEFIKK